MLIFRLLQNIWKNILSLKEIQYETNNNSENPENPVGIQTAYQLVTNS